MPPTPRGLFLSLCFCLCLLSSCRDTSHIGLGHILVVCCSVAKSYPAFCDSMYRSMPGFPVLHYLQEFAQTLVHWVGDAIQPSHLDVKLITSMKTLFLKWVNFQRYLGLGFQCIFGRAKLNPWPCLNKECGWNLGKEWRREGDESSGWVSGIGSCRLCVSKALLSEKRNLGPAFWQGILGSSTFQERRLREIWNLWNGQRRGELIKKKNEKHEKRWSVDQWSGRDCPRNHTKGDLLRSSQEKKAGNLLGSPLWWSQSDWESRGKKQCGHWIWGKCGWVLRGHGSV